MLRAIGLILCLRWFSLVDCEITIEGVSCGSRSCKWEEYCSNYDKTCQPCSEICNKSTHNFEHSLCEKDCQDYLHDSRYARLDGDTKGGSTEDLKKTVSQLSRMVTVTLTLVCFMLVVLASVLCFQLYRWKIKKNITLSSLKAKLFNKKVPDNDIPSKTNKVSDTANKKTDLRLEIPSPGTQSDNSPATVTTSISRRPAEDSALDYAYDNPAMTAHR